MTASFPGIINFFRPAYRQIPRLREMTSEEWGWPPKLVNHNKFNTTFGANKIALSPKKIFSLNAGDDQSKAENMLSRIQRNKLISLASKRKERQTSKKNASKVIDNIQSIKEYLKVQRETTVLLRFLQVCSEKPAFCCVCFFWFSARNLHFA